MIRAYRNRRPAGQVWACSMYEQKAHDLLRKHNLTPDDVKERRATLHHLRRIVHAEALPFDVFKTIVKMRR